jgi:hypothetical protein
MREAVFICPKPVNDKIPDGALYSNLVVVVVPSLLFCLMYVPVPQLVIAGV